MKKVKVECHQGLSEKLRVARHLGLLLTLLLGEILCIL